MRTYFPAGFSCLKVTSAAIAGLLVLSAPALAQDGTDPFFSVPESQETAAPEAVQTAPARSQEVAMKADPGAAEADAADKKSSVYDEWAKKLLEQESTITDQQHPLALQHPDHFVVVCEAGCEARQVQVVYMERQDARGPVNGPGAALPEIPPEAALNVVTCVGGCYSGTDVMAGAATVNYSPTADNSWLTTVKPTAVINNADKPKSDASGRWYERMGNSTKTQ